MLKRTLLAYLSMAALSLPLWADDGGELFTNVPYDKAVDAPKLTDRTDPPPVIVPHTQPATQTTVPATHDKPITGSRTATTQTAPKVDPNNSNGGDAAKPAANPVRSGPYFWSPYAASLLAPLLPPELKPEYNKIAAAISLGSTPAERCKAADAFAEAAKKTDDTTLKRFLMIRSLSLAIQGGAAPTVRESLTNQLLPMLEIGTLPVAQVKTEVLEALGQATQPTPPKPKFLMTLVNAYADLAVSQVQVGYPAEASTSIRRARTVLGSIPMMELWRALGPGQDPSKIYFAQYWLNRSEAAKNMAPQLKASLANKPNDPAINTQVSTLYLSLYADLANAARHAGKSDKPEFLAFAKLVSPLDLKTVDPDTAEGLSTSFAICGTLLDVAAGRTDHFDAYAIADYVDGQLQRLTEKTKGEDKSKIPPLRDRAQELIDKNKPELPAELAPIGGRGGRHRRW